MTTAGRAPDDAVGGLGAVGVSVPGLGGGGAMFPAGAVICGALLRSGAMSVPHAAPEPVPA